MTAEATAQYRSDPDKRQRAYDSVKALDRAKTRLAANHPQEMYELLNEERVRLLLPPLDLVRQGKHRGKYV